MTKQIVRLTEMVAGGGCAAKLGPIDLSSAVRSLKSSRAADPNILVGFDRLDDAGVYKLSETQALVQTLDFITPIVDDPFTFGQIAAANAISDVYAMGGEPVTALNIVCFPRAGDQEILAEILRGGLAKADEAGVALVGGHSICDPEIKYGMSVTGLVDPRKMWTNAGAQPGDTLVFTKRLGTGIVSSAIKEGAASDELITAAVDSMTMLNQSAKRLGENFDVHACTDITGFSLCGHLYQLAKASGVSIRLDSSAIPLLPGVLELARRGIQPSGLERNRDYASAFVSVWDGVDQALVDILYDPQTSGGLLLAMPASQAEEYVSRRRANGEQAALVGMAGTQSTDSSMLTVE